MSAPTSPPSDGRRRILERLRAAPTLAVPAVPDVAGHYRTLPVADAATLRQQFVERLGLWRAEVHTATASNWPETLCRIVAQKNIRRLLCARHTPLGATLAATALGADTTLRDYDAPVDGWKDELFNEVDAAITRTRGGIAETGTLILWPDADEPRLMSLVPPIHIALVDAQKIHPTFHAAMQAEGWAGQLPTNALLISGPSKTADIQQTLAYGAHGPRELVVILLTEETAP